MPLHHYGFAEDTSNNVFTGYTGTVHFSSSDSQAVLPANATLTNGIGIFSVTLVTPGNQILTAADSTASNLNGTSNAIAVNAAAANHFVVSGVPSTITAGTAFNFTVTAEDAFNNTDTAYGGTVHFTSSDSLAALPAERVPDRRHRHLHGQLDKSGQPDADGHRRAVGKHQREGHAYGKAADGFALRRIDQPHYPSESSH